MTAERVVIDTNVLISALLQPRGRTAAVLDAIRDADGMLLFADETFVAVHGNETRRLHQAAMAVVVWSART